MIAILAALPAVIIGIVLIGSALSGPGKATPGDAVTFFVGLAFQVCALCIARWL